MVAPINMNLPNSQTTPDEDALFAALQSESSHPEDAGKKPEQFADEYFHNHLAGLINARTRAEKDALAAIRSLPPTSQQVVADAISADIAAKTPAITPPIL